MAELALQMYMEDLRTCDATLSDRKMAQSVATAVLRDGALIHRAYEKERQIARDRELATTLTDYTGTAMIGTLAENAQQDEVDIWSDPELLAKAAAIYMSKPGPSSSRAAVTTESDSDDTATIAESSAWAASRDTSDTLPVGHCVICGDDKEFFDVARVSCGHEYCRDCLAELFRHSMRDESLFPPRCDGQVIPLAQVRLFVPSDLAKEFESKARELSTKNRTYCHEPTCSTFIDGNAINDEVGTCSKCRKTTCVTCKAPSHSGDCPEDTALTQLKQTADVEQWQRCYACSRFVQLETGCNHMT